jgi:hypothetical protein
MDHMDNMDDVDDVDGHGRTQIKPTAGKTVA